MAFFNSAVDVLQTLVVALGAGLGIWGVINLIYTYAFECGSYSSTLIVKNLFTKIDLTDRWFSSD